MNISKGDSVIGVDLYGKEVTGRVENIMKVFKMAQVRFSKDRLGITTCNISDLKNINNNEYIKIYRNLQKFNRILQNIKS